MSASRNEGITIIADFTDRAVSLTGIPEDPNRKFGRSKNAGITLIADFTDIAQPVDEAGPAASTATGSASRSLTWRNTLFAEGQ
jgi:hypothetical protein